ncbi:RNA polymerase sigma-70 factor [Kitasatospora kifunensis]
MSTAAPTARPVREEAFLAHRPMLLSLAYRLLGSVHDAEDTVQDAYLRWSADERDTVENPAAFLTTTVTRLALDRLRSAAVRREAYVGAWLPEPLPTGPQDLAETAALRDSASIAMLVLLDRLSPAERAVFVLREAFELPYDEIAAILERSAASCRQLHHRAMRHVAAGPRPVPAPDPVRGRQLVQSFLSAAQSGDLGRLTAILRDDVVLTTDGGGKVQGAGRRPILGAAKSARLFAAVFARHYQRAVFHAVRFNHAPALLIEAGDRRVLYVFDFAADGLISNVYAIINPDKLAHIAAD